MAKRMKKHRGPVDLTAFSTPQPFKKVSAPARSLLVTESMQHGEILPASVAVSKGCVTKGGKPPRPGQVELIFLKRGGDMPAGPALRFCTAPGVGSILPVKGPFEAKKIAQRYQGCVKGAKAKVKSCTVKFTGS